MDVVEAYQPDRSWRGKLRRRVVRLAARRPAVVRLERPIVSFTFDDAPLSATQTGAALLEAAGARGTYYIAAGLCGRTGPMGRFAGEGDVRRLAAAGHEIACHTHSHRDCGQAAADETAAEAEENARTLGSWGVPAPSNFAYPYGDVSEPAKRALAERFRTLRALHHGLIETGCDLNQAPAVGIEGPEGEAVAASWLDAASRRRAWLVLYTHDVADDPSEWGCTPAALQRLISRATASGFDILTVEQAAERIGA